jgi:hypothetical protein
MTQEITGSVSPHQKNQLKLHETRNYWLSIAQDHKNQLRIRRDQKIRAQYHNKTRKNSSEFHETRRYRLSIAARPEKPAENSMRPENTGSVSPQDQKNQFRIP